MASVFDILGTIFGILSLCGSLKVLYKALRIRQPPARIQELEAGLRGARLRVDELVDHGYLRGNSALASEHRRSLDMIDQDSYHARQCASQRPPNTIMAVFLYACSNGINCTLSREIVALIKRVEDVRRRLDDHDFPPGVAPAHTMTAHVDLDSDSNRLPTTTHATGVRSRSHAQIGVTIVLSIDIGVSEIRRRRGHIVSTLVEHGDFETTVVEPINQCERENAMGTICGAAVRRTSLASNTLPLSTILPTMSALVDWGMARVPTDASCLQGHVVRTLVTQALAPMLLQLSTLMNDGTLFSIGAEASTAPSLPGSCIDSQQSGLTENISAIFQISVDVQGFVGSADAVGRITSHATTPGVDGQYSGDRSLHSVVNSNGALTVRRPHPPTITTTTWTLHYSPKDDAGTSGLRCNRGSGRCSYTYLGGIGFIPPSLWVADLPTQTPFPPDGTASFGLSPSKWRSMHDPLFVARMRPGEYPLSQVLRWEAPSSVVLALPDVSAG
ncbi:hypothetical protein C8Q77DRAFT_1118234 [Trametes polyzona]|nr:hypothetical protein C8Q77DRAFT_1118234 [Trametes polyzona]